MAITGVLTGFGWRVWVADEPDGSVTAYLGDYDSGERLKMAHGDDWVDAVLALLSDVLPPSLELRRERLEHRRLSGEAE